MKKSFAAILAALLLASSVMPVFAAPSEGILVSEKPTVSYTAEPTAEDMEKMLKTVKPKLGVPEDCTVFSWYYNAPSYYNCGTWSFTWQDKDYNKYVNVNVDDKGRVLNYDTYDYSEYKYSNGIQLPKMSRDALAEKAYDELMRLCPEAAGMKLTNAMSGSIWSKEYYYTFTRYENDVIVPDNTATVSMDYTTGKLRSLSCNYHYDVKIDDAAPAVSLSEAKKLLGGEQTMKLSYRLKTEYDDDWNIKSRKAYLVYTPEIGYLSVDAATGKVYTERNTWNVATEALRAANGSMKYAASADMAVAEEADMDDGYYTLTEEELAEKEILASLMSKADAIAAVTSNPYLYIDPDATAVEAHLTYQSGSIYGRNTEEAKKHYQWNITFTAPSYDSSAENGYFRPNMSAAVDAHDGKILSFRANVPSYRYYLNDHRKLELPTLSFDKEQAAAKFEEFVKTVAPDRFALTHRTETSDGTVLTYLKPEIYEEPVYRTTNLTYCRVNEGIDFSQNAIYGSVDLVSGKVTSFNSTWYDDVTFESPKNIITPEQAYEVIMNGDGFGLNYEINSNYTYNKYLADEEQGYIDYSRLYETEMYTRLVYSAYHCPTTTVSALTGKLLDYSGEEYKPAVACAYGDIENHWARAYIETLVDLDITFEGDNFRPDENITVKDYLYLMNGFGKYPRLLTEELDALAEDAELTRADAVRYLIDAEGYAKIAAMPNIFITDFADNSSLKPEDVGFIAIARGFGLVQGDVDGFRPYDKLTRAEAACLLINFAGCEF